MRVRTLRLTGLDTLASVKLQDDERRGLWRHPAYPDGTASTHLRLPIKPYLKSQPVFHCPADTGTCDFGFDCKKLVEKLRPDV